MVARPRAQLLEIRNPVLPAHDSFTVNRGRLDPQRAQCILDPREAPGPVEPAPCEDARPLAVATHDQAVAIVLDFVNPLPPAGRCGAYGWQTWVYEAHRQYGRSTRGTPLHAAGMPDVASLCNRHNRRNGLMGERA